MKSMPRSSAVLMLLYPVLAVLCVSAGARLNAQQSQNQPQPQQTQVQPQAEAVNGQAVFDAALEALAKQVNDNPNFIKSEQFKKLPIELRTAVIKRAADDNIKQQTEEEEKAQAAAKAAAAKAVQEQAKEKQQAAAQPCTPAQPKKNPFVAHIPRGLQAAINKDARKIGDKTGVDLDPNTPATVLKDAQAQKAASPCAKAPSPAEH